MSTGLSTKKLLTAFGIFVAIMVGSFVLIVALMFSFIEPTTIDESDPDYLALQRFFRNPPTELMESHLLDGSFAVLSELSSTRLPTDFKSSLSESSVDRFENERSEDRAIESAKEVARRYWKI